MPWPTVRKDILTAFEGVEEKLSIDVQRFEAIVIADMIPDTEARLQRMLRAVSAFSRPCRMKDKGCSAHVWFIQTDPGGPGQKPTYVPVVLVQDEYGAWIVRNHFRDCPGADQASTRPAGSLRTPTPTPPARKAQTTLFDVPEASRPAQKEYPD